MTRYAEGKDYRLTLGSRPRQSSTPEAHEPPALPVRHHPGLAEPHKETVGFLGTDYHEPTHPNAERRLGTDAHLNQRGKASRSPLGTLNRVKLKPKS